MTVGSVSARQTAAFRKPAGRDLPYRGLGVLTCLAAVVKSRFGAVALTRIKHLRFQKQLGPTAHAAGPNFERLVSQD